MVLMDEADGIVTFSAYFPPLKSRLNISYSNSLINFASQGIVFYLYVSREADFVFYLLLSFPFLGC